MLSGEGSLTSADIDELARLQTEILPLSLISRLGYRYARSFYRYAVRSPKELLFTDRGDDGQTVAGCVVSLDIASLEHRLLRSTPLVPAALLRLPWLLDARSSAQSTEVQGAELMLLFTAARARGRGSASRLVARAEAELRIRGIGSYLVRTFDDPIDPAYRFYLARDFERIQAFNARGVRFALMRKTLSE